MGIFLITVQTEGTCLAPQSWGPLCQISHKGKASVKSIHGEKKNTEGFLNFMEKNYQEN